MAIEKTSSHQTVSTRIRHRLPDARRASPPELDDHVQKVSGSPVVTALLETVDAILVVLNEQRQIVALNDRLALLGGEAQAIGLRLGEALWCVNAQGPSGCGSTPGCEICGALSAILRCQADRRAVEAECLLRATVPDGTSLELNVRAAPLDIAGAPFTVLSLRDISDEKRRHALEQIFLHDVMNVVTGLRGWTRRLRRSTLEDPAAVRASERIDILSRQIEREIQDHRALTLAERGSLTPSHALLTADDVLGAVEAVFSADEIGEERRLEIEAAPGLTVYTDAALLLRVLGNMVRNALEATPARGTVRVWCTTSDDGADAASIQFHVWNEGVIPAAIQASLFQRSFSTKAPRGRGLGTYAMKLLGEKVLGGRVTFVSDPDRGTVFSIELPPCAVPGGAHSATA